MRFDVARAGVRGEAGLPRASTAPGLGVLAQPLTPGVKTYQYLKQVTNLAAPAVYRALVRFRWLDAKDT